MDKHVHVLRAKPAKDYLPKPIPPSHPALQEPHPMAAWVCIVPNCTYVSWTSEWFRGR